MNFFNRLFSLCNDGLKKLAYLIRERLNMIEVKILFLGLVLAALTGIYYLYLLYADPGLYRVLFSTAIVHMMGGRGLGIVTCLSAGISLFYTILYNFFLEVVIVLIAYGIVVLVMRNIIQPKLFDSAVRKAELTAQSQKTKIKKYGSIGLFLFVMFPFFMTGPVIGAIIGYLLNYRAINNFLIVFSGTLTSIMIYALIGNNFIIIREQSLDDGLVKAGKENPKQHIIYFCNFGFLNQALAIDPRVGLFLRAASRVADRAHGCAFHVDSAGLTAACHVCRLSSLRFTFTARHWIICLSSLIRHFCWPSEPCEAARWKTTGLRRWL